MKTIFIFVFFILAPKAWAAETITEAGVKLEKNISLEFPRVLTAGLSYGGNRVQLGANIGGMQNKGGALDRGFSAAGTALYFLPGGKITLYIELGYHYLYLGNSEHSYNGPSWSESRTYEFYEHAIFIAPMVRYNFQKTDHLLPYAYVGIYAPNIINRIQETSDFEFFTGETMSEGRASTPL